MNEHVLKLKPKRDQIKFMLPGVCRGSWLDPESKGCGHLVRLHYMHGSFGRKGPLPKSAVCPVCGEHYVFAFYKMKEDREHSPTKAQEKDIRSFWGDVKRLMKGKEVERTVRLEERVELHCLRASCDGDGHVASQAPVQLP